MYISELNLPLRITEELYQEKDPGVKEKSVEIRI